MPRTRWKVGERGGLGSERFQDFGMKRVAGAERLARLRVVGVPGQHVFVGKPKGAVGVNDGVPLWRVNLRKQTAEQDVNGLVVLGRIQERGLPCRNALRLGHLVGDELVLAAVGIAGLAFLPDGERIDQGHARIAFDGFEQRREEGAHLLPGSGAVKLACLAQIDGKLVQQDERRLAAEKFGQRLRAGSGVALVALADAVVTGLAGERVGEFAPRRVGEDTFAHVAAVGGVGVLAVESGDADFAGGDELRVNELADVGNAFHAVGRVGERYQAVRLAAAVTGVEAEYCGSRTAVAAQTGHHVAQQVLEALRGVGVGEKTLGLLVVVGGDAANDLGQVGGKIGLGERAFQHVFTRLAVFKDSWQVHTLICITFVMKAGFCAFMPGSGRLNVETTPLTEGPAPSGLRSRP